MPEPPDALEVPPVAVDAVRVTVKVPVEAVVGVDVVETVCPAVSDPLPVRVPNAVSVRLIVPESD